MISDSRLIELACQAAKSTPANHSYLPKEGQDFLPHDWVIDAMRLSVADSEKKVSDLQAALEDANSLCRSCYQVVERIAVVEGDVAFGSAFGRLHQALKSSLERQHAVMYPTIEQDKEND